MNLADYLIGNSDEHGQNWGFLYDNNFDVLSINPLMDFDHAFESDDNSICLPLRFLGERSTQKEEAIKIVKRHPEWLSKSIDLSEFKYGDVVNERIELLRSALVCERTEPYYTKGKRGR